jgi:hypothetical protein
VPEGSLVAVTVDEHDLVADVLGGAGHREQPEPRDGPRLDTGEPPDEEDDEEAADAEADAT